MKICKHHRSLTIARSIAAVGVSLMVARIFAPELVYLVAPVVLAGIAFFLVVSSAMNRWLTKRDFHNFNGGRD